MKKLTYEEFGKVMYHASLNQWFHNLRQGQSLFNALFNYHPELADSIRGTGADCFHQDSKIIHFIDAILEK